MNRHILHWTRCTVNWSVTCFWYCRTAEDTLQRLRFWLLLTYLLSVVISRTTFSFSVLTASFQVNLGWPVFIEAKMMELVATTALLELQVVQSSSQIITTNKPKSSFYTGRMPFLSPNQPTVSKHWKGNIHAHIWISHGNLHVEVCHLFILNWHCKSCRNVA